MEEASSSSTRAKDNKHPKQNRTPSKDHIFRKRKPQKPEEGNSVIYVSTKTSTNALLQRCTKLIQSGENKLTLFCLGAAIQRGILLALKLSEQNPSFKINTNTFTTELIDDLEPATDDADYAIQRRCNSALKIQIFRQDPIAATTES